MFNHDHSSLETEGDEVEKVYETDNLIEVNAIAFGWIEEVERQRYSQNIHLDKLVGYNEIWLKPSRSRRCSSKFVQLCLQAHPCRDWTEVINFDGQDQIDNIDDGDKMATSSWSSMSTNTTSEVDDIN